MTSDRQIYSQLGAVVRDRREKQGLTQSELAARVGLRRTSITNIEAGQQGLTLQSFVQLARSLETSPGELLETALAHEQPASPLDGWIASVAGDGALTVAPRARKVSL